MFYNVRFVPQGAGTIEYVDLEEFSRSPRIQVVEDESVIAQEITERLEDLGCRVAGWATTGDEALRLAEETRPDLVLMDIRLKGDMDGIEAAGLIRDRLNLPVIFVTAFLDDETLERAKVVEPHGYLVKPIENKNLQSTIKIALYKHRMERQLEAHSEQLEFQVRERTAELASANERLNAAYEELKSVDELKDNIISNISHELRTPLTVAMSALELLADLEDPAAKKELITKSLESMERQNQIIENLISVSDIYGDKFGLNVSKVDPIHLMVRIIGSRVCDMKRKSLRVEENFIEDPCIIIADEKKLHLAFSNLVDNAIKFNPVGGTVGVTIKRQGGELTVSISDEGIGLKEGEHEKIFSPLTQLDPSITRCHGGTGCGLSISKHIIEEHGGRIEVRSDGPGKGTTFEIKLPLNK